MRNNQIRFHTDLAGTRALVWHHGKALPDPSVDRANVRMYAISVQKSCAQQLQQARRLPANNILRTRCSRASSGRPSLVPPRAAHSTAVDTTPHLVIDSPDDVPHSFGQPGDFVTRGIEAVHWINGKSEKPYKGPGIKINKHDGMFGRERFFVQNKGLVLYACNNPLPHNVAAANDTEKAIILAIAMQETEFMDTFDASKKGKAENKSCLNVNVDMLERANRDWGSAVASSNDYGELRAVVGCLLKWFRGQASPSQDGRPEHLKDALNFLRGGYDAFHHDGAISFSKKEVDTSDYINAIASIYRELRWRSQVWDDKMGKQPDSTRTGTENWDSKNLWANNVRIEIAIPGI